MSDPNDPLSRRRLIGEPPLAAEDPELVRLRRRERALETANTALRVLLASQPSGRGDRGGASLGDDHALLSATVEKARSAMVVTDPTLPDNPIVFANKAFRTLTGYSAEEVIGRNCRFMQGPGTDPAGIAAMSDAIRNRHDATIDLLNYRKDGSSFINELFISPVFGPDGDLRYFFGCQTDVTQLRNASERLVGAEHRWRQRFERLQEGFLVGEMLWDASGEPQDFRYLEVNDAWGRLTGLPIETTLGRPNSEVLPELESEWLDDFAAVALSGEPRTETRWVRALGRAYEARIFRPEPGQFAVLFQDVSLRLREEARRDVLLQLSDILREENHPDELAHRAAALLGQKLGVSRAGYGTIDLATETILIAPDWRGPGIRSIAGTLRFRDYGSYIDDLKKGVTVVIDDTRLDPRTAVNSADLEAISARSFINMPVTEEGGFVALLFLNNDVPRAWTEDEISLMREVAERTRVAVARRRAERDLRQLTASLESKVEARTAALLAAEEQLRQSQKMEAVGQLTGGIAHDFNNLLTGISGSLELLTVRLAQGRLSELGRYAAAAQAAAQRAAALTHRLLAFSRRQTLDPKPTAADVLVDGMEEMIRRTVGPAIEIVVRHPAGLWPAIVDPNQLENALLNLCLNARDAMPDGGCITIETENAALDAAAARARDLPAGDYVSLCVIDTGTGMTADVIARAFDPFFTTKPLGQGTGLGLSMIYGFVRQSGGQVRITSEPGQGTTMCLYLPRHHGTLDGHGPRQAAGTPQRAEQGETVLVVDDEPSVRMLVTEVLEELGYVAIEAEDGGAGLQVLQSGVRVDLLVTDVGLPGGMNGRQVADAARILRPDLKVLFITGYAENAVVQNGHLEPGMHVLTKPFTIDLLADRIRSLIETP